MNIFGLDISLARKSQAISLDTLIRRLEAIHETVSGIAVTPENCMESPTVQAIVTGVARKIASLPVHVLQQTTEGKRTKKERLPNHPVTALLRSPNDWQDRVSYWLDATSWLVRYGNHFAFKARGQTGPIRRLIPLPAGSVQVKQADDLTVTYEVALEGGGRREYTRREIHHVRGPARNGFTGDSPIADVREAIALEIAAEKFGAAFFGNGAMPGIVFKYAAGSLGHKTDEERKKFVDDFQALYAKRGRFRAMLLPSGIEQGDSVGVENDKAQFLETRKYQRSVIAGAFGMPAHMVGDLERGTFRNVEQQSQDFVQNVVLPFARMFEAAMERDLLTDTDRRNGVIIRFNLDGALRADFKSRQEGLRIQRDAGVINPNEWREGENMNPISEEDGGETYWLQGPSGQSGLPNEDATPPREGDDDA